MALSDKVREVEKKIERDSHKTAKIDIQGEVSYVTALGGKI